MNTKEACYLFFDFDGTVFMGGEIPTEHREAMAAAQALGHQLILNTGRARGGLDFSKARYQGVNWDGMIFGGCDISYRGRRDHAHHLDEAAVLRWMDYAMEKEFWITLEGEEEVLRFHLDKEDFEPKKQGRDHLLGMAKALMQRTTVTKLSLGGLDADAPVTAESVIKHDHYAEVLPRGRDKGVAVLDFCRIHSVDLEQCVCFGDSLNDLAVFHVCPTSICMKKSEDAVKQLATYCARGEFGVEEGLKWLFGNDLDLTNKEKSGII